MFANINMDDFFEDMFSRKKKKKQDKNELLHKLYVPPIKDKGGNMPRFQVLTPHITYQADLLEMPNDKGYRYILVVVDAYDKKTDAEAIKSKDAKTVLAALETIMRRNILQIPRRLEVDKGSEFKSVFAKWAEDNKVQLRVAETGRHRQQAIVERKNQSIVKALFKKMSAKELVTGKESKEWQRYLHLLVKAMNNNLIKPKVKKPEDMDITAEGDSKILLPPGTKVRTALEEPTDAITGLRLPGRRFRTGDLRWDTKIRVIKKVILHPDKPPLYLLDGDSPNGTDNISRTKNQLQVVGDKEVYPTKEQAGVTDKEDQYVIDRIVGERTKKGKKEVRIRWAGYEEKDDTWEPFARIKKEAPEAIREYEKKLR
jgi:transposase InsO family protein